MSDQRVITDTNKGPLVQVLALYFLVLTVLSCVVRSSTRIFMARVLKLDDVLVIVATGFASIQTVLIFVSSDYGLGRPFESLTPNSTAIFLKTQYAADIMFVTSLFFSKLSGTMGLRMMSRRSQKWIIIACEVIVSIWGVSALVVTALQCKLPTPWDYTRPERCMNRTTFWTCYSAVNMATDVVIVAIMAENIRRIQTSITKKILVITVFGSRILVVPAIAAQIYYSNRSFSSPDLSFSLWQPTVAIQLVQCLAIFTVCVPNLKPFLDSLESGQIRIDDIRRQGKSNSNGYPTYQRKYAGYRSPMQSKNSDPTTSNAAARRRDDNMSIDVMTSADGSHLSNVHEMVDLPKSRTREAGLAIADEPSGAGGSWDRQSHTSHSSQTILIQQSWQVERVGVDATGRN